MNTDKPTRPILGIFKAPEPRAEPAKPNVLTFKLTVPAGHVLPLGETVEEAFDVTVVAGARWFPEWTEPRIGVTAFYMLPQGDAICFAGEEAKALPLPEAVASMAEHHGEEITEGHALALSLLGLAPPTKPEPYSAFHAVRASKPYTIH